MSCTECAQCKQCNDVNGLEMLCRNDCFVMTRRPFVCLFVRLFLFTAFDRLGAYPGITRHQAGIPPGWGASALQGISIGAEFIVKYHSDSKI